MSIQRTAQNLLSQLDEVLASISHEEFSKPLEVLSQSSIGQHVRHSLEFFICLMDGRNEGKINYDLRKHDEHIETDLKLARSIISSIIDFLEKLDNDCPVIFEAKYGHDDDKNIGVNSSLFREVSYNIEHLIHHMALLKIGLRSLNPSIGLPLHFGVASSTVRHQMKSE